MHCLHSPNYAHVPGVIVVQQSHPFSKSALNARLVAHCASVHCVHAHAHAANGLSAIITIAIVMIVAAVRVPTQHTLPHG
jgi:hypothetical protein